MSRWPTSSLGDLVRFVGGGTPSRKRADYWNGPIPWASVKDLSSPELGSTIESITEEGLANSAANLIPPQTAILASRVGLGKVAINSMPVAINQDLKAAIPIDGKVLPRYLLYYLQSRAREIEWMGAGATVKGVTVAQLASLNVPLPPLAEQERIVRMLDEAESIRKLRARADDRTAELIPALFHEMFGDPVTNPMRWPEEQVGNLLDESRGGTKTGPFGSALKKHEYVSAGVPVWGIPNVEANRFIEQGSLYITEEKYRLLSAYSVRWGDLMISRAGTVGRVCVAKPNAEKSIIGTNLVRVSPNRERIVPEFLSTLLTHFGKDLGNIRADSDESAYSFLSTRSLRSMRIFVPSLALQEDYVRKTEVFREIEATQRESAQCIGEQGQALLHALID